jgi:hypothetical protein
MVTQTEQFTLFEHEKDSSEASYSGYSLLLKQITCLVHERNEFNYNQFKKRSEDYFVTTSEEEKLADAKGFYSKEEAYAYAEKIFQKKLNGLIHSLQDLIS